MASGTGRAKLQYSYTRWLQKNTWAAILEIKPELEKLNPDFHTMSIKKGWAFLDMIEKKFNIDRKLVEEKTRFL